MLIYNVHKSIIVMNSLDARFSKNVFEAVQKTRSTCFIGSKHPLKHSCSFFKHNLIIKRQKLVECVLVRQGIPHKLMYLSKLRRIVARPIQLNAESLSSIYFLPRNMS